MDITLLWESSKEEDLKDAVILAKSAWTYTNELFELVNGQYYAAKKEDYELFLSVCRNRNFWEKKNVSLKKPILYFAGHYPTLTKECFVEFMSQAKQVGQAILYAPSEKWAEEKEIICIFYQPNIEGRLEKTLAIPLPRLNAETQLWKIKQNLCQNQNLEWIKKGVKIVDISATWIEDTAEIASGVVLQPGTHILGHSKIEEGSNIGPNCYIRDSIIGKNNQIIQAQIEESEIGQECNIGPFSYIRPNSKIGNRVRIGDFVEIKNSSIGDDTMISHLTYVGDADVGNNVNFGCGTILVNYDGIKKHRSIIEANAFIGCNSNLVSPVHIGRDAFIAAGSTITQDLPPESLGIARVRQQIKENWVTSRNKTEKSNNNVEGGKTDEQS